MGKQHSLLYGKVDFPVMPVIDVYMWAGRTPDQKKNIIKGITDVFVKEGAPAGAVTVILHDIPKENWGTAGKSADEA